MTIPKKGAEWILRNFHFDGSILEKALDSWGSAGDVHVSFHVFRYPKSAHLHDWNRVGESLYGAIGAYDEPRIERREEGPGEQRGSKSSLVAVC